MSAIYGVGASLGIGVGDHLTRGAADRGGIRQTLSAVFLAGVLVAVAGALLFSSEWRSGDMVVGAVSGVTAAGALACLYRGYAAAAAGVVGPSAAVVAVALPVAVDFVGGPVPPGRVVAGIALGVGSVLLVSYGPRRLGDVRRGLAFGVLAGILYGGMYVLLDQVAAEAGFWPIVAQRTVAFAIMGAITLRIDHRMLPSRRITLRASLGALVAGAGAMSFLYGLQHGDLAPVTVAGGQYAAVTVVCGYLFRNEHLRPLQWMGLAGTVGSLGLIVSG